MFAGFYDSLNGSARQDVDIELVARCCLTEIHPELMLNTSLALDDCDCLQEKLSVAAALNISGQDISVCNEEFPPLYRSVQVSLYTVQVLISMFISPACKMTFI